MVVLFGATGQLCNRLFNISSFLGNALEYGYRLNCLGFEEYYKLFENINVEVRGKNIKFNEPGFLSSLKAKACYKSGSVLRRLKLPHQISYISLYEQGGNLRDTGYQKAVESHRHLFVSGWPYWDTDSFIKHGGFLKKVFTPKTEYREVASEFINKCRITADVLIGVHVRRGDYREYCNGRFYYTDEDYLRFIENLHEQFSSNSQRVTFIIFSNEEVNLRSTYAKILVSKMNAICDLAAMGCCDYLLGPPSTFSMWASFYGAVPHQWIVSAKTNIERNSFSPIVAPNTYQNGQTISLDTL